MDRSFSWRLWNLQSLIPDATERTLKKIESNRNKLSLDGEKELSSLKIEQLLQDAKQFIKKHPQLTKGITVTMHIGPYAFIPGLHLLAGATPVVLSSSQAKRDIEPEIKTLQSLPGLSGHLKWITTDQKNFNLQIFRELKQENPLVVYLDGNSGRGGMRKTREDGIPLQLPGRTIRVRDGIARLATRMKLPVHGVVCRWMKDDTVDWSLGFSKKWDQKTSPEEVTKEIFNWGFSEVIKTPEQWSLPTIIGASSECFREDRLFNKEEMKKKIKQFRKLNNSTKILLRHDVELWEPDILADRKNEKFYSSEGLTKISIDLLKTEGGNSIATLRQICGSKWLNCHGARLFALGLIDIRESA